MMSLEKDANINHRRLSSSFSFYLFRGHLHLFALTMNSKRVSAIKSTRNTFCWFQKLLSLDFRLAGWRFNTRAAHKLQPQQDQLDNHGIVTLIFKQISYNKTDNRIGLEIESGWVLEFTNIIIAPGVSWKKNMIWAQYLESGWRASWNEISLSHVYYFFVFHSNKC